MKSVSQDQPLSWPWLAWSSVAAVGIVAPATAMLLLMDASVPAALAATGGPILAIALMGTGMIAAAAAGRLWVGVILALVTGAGLTLLVHAFGLPALPRLAPTGLAAVIASISFAARGALFARSAAAKGWWIALAVVAGEAAVVLTAAAAPGVLPDWLLALLPAQWANMAIQSALTGTSAMATSSPLIALGGTAAATLFVAWLWPRRWPYLVMFTTWLGLSALVYHYPHF